MGDALGFSESRDRVCGKRPHQCYLRVDKPQDDEIETIYGQLEAEFGAVFFEAWLALLVRRWCNQEQRLIFIRWISRKTTRPPLISFGKRFAVWLKIRFVYRSESGLNEKVYVTELDFQHASLPPVMIRFLEQVMPAAMVRHDELESETTNGATRMYDCRFRVVTEFVGADWMVDNMFLQTTFAR